MVTFSFKNNLLKFKKLLGLENRLLFRKEKISQIAQLPSPPTRSISEPEVLNPKPIKKPQITSSKYNQTQISKIRKRRRKRDLAFESRRSQRLSGRYRFP